MERTQYDWQHDYMLTPNNYSISSNDADSTYDQFLTLRETLIYTWKFYNNKAGKKLCVWDKGDWTTTNTIEVWLPNIFRQSFNNDWSSTSVEPLLLGSYISKIPSDLVSTMWNLACLIKKDWRYRITHKEEILLSTSTNKVYCYVDVYRKDVNNQYKVAIKWWICVFDWEWTWTYYTLWQLFKKMTASWYIETDLFKDDILVLRMKDADCNSSTWEPQWNNLTIQNNSNYWNIEYLDLPYNN
jgi:hypothetical protein